MNRPNFFNFSAFTTVGVSSILRRIPLWLEVGLFRLICVGVAIYAMVFSSESSRLGTYVVGSLSTLLLFSSFFGFGTRETRMERSHFLRLLVGASLVWHGSGPLLILGLFLVYFYPWAIGVSQYRYREIGHLALFFLLPVFLLSIAFVFRDFWSPKIYFYLVFVGAWIIQVSVPSRRNPTDVGRERTLTSTVMMLLAFPGIAILSHSGILNMIQMDHIFFYPSLIVMFASIFLAFLNFGAPSLGAFSLVLLVFQMNLVWFGILAGGEVALLGGGLQIIFTILLGGFLVVLTSRLEERLGTIEIPLMDLRGIFLRRFRVLFLLSFLAVANVPLMIGFVAEDILVQSILEHSFLVAVGTLASVLLMSVSILLTYSRLFSGKSHIEDARFDLSKVEFGAGLIFLVFAGGFYLVLS